MHIGIQYRKITINYVQVSKFCKHITRVRFASSAVPRMQSRVYRSVYEVARGAAVRVRRLSARRVG